MQDTGIRGTGIALAGIVAFAASCGIMSQGASAAKPARSGDSQIYFEKTSSDETSPIRYVARSRSYDVYISREEADVVLHAGLEQASEAARGKVIVVRAHANVLRLRFVNSNLPTKVEPFAQQSGAASFDALAYRGIYPGADVIVRASRGRLGFQLALSPGAHTEDIVLEIGGTTSIDLDARGNAIVHAGHEAIVLQRPAVELQGAAGKQASAGTFEIESANRLRFILTGNLQQPRLTIAD